MWCIFETVWHFLIMCLENIFGGKFQSNIFLVNKIQGLFYEENKSNEAIEAHN